MSRRSPVATILTIIMDVLVVVAVADTIRVIIRFFGQLASQDWAGGLIALTAPLTLPLGVEAVKTPYGGVFDVNAALTVAVVLIIEWMLSVVRSRV